MEMRILAIIPARGGSKGIPRKNIKPLAGKPLIGWTIDIAKRVKSIDRIVVSTEDTEIASIATQLGADVPFLRPVHLSADDAPSIGAVLHALEILKGYEWVMLLQPTSPLRSLEDIENLLVFCEERGAPAAVSVCEVNQHPSWMYRRDTMGYLQPLVTNSPKIYNRQSLPPTYTLNGSIYLARTDWLRERCEFISPDTLGYVMPPERSVDIDTTLDWLWSEFLIEKLYDRQNISNRC
jgi:CMP-N,N'-diacetyllegionaminic acid synthase